MLCRLLAVGMHQSRSANNIDSKTALTKSTKTKLFSFIIKEYKKKNACCECITASPNTESLLIAAHSSLCCQLMAAICSQRALHSLQLQWCCIEALHDAPQVLYCCTVVILLWYDYATGSVPQVKQLGISNIYDLAALQAIFKAAQVKPSVVQNRCGCVQLQGSLSEKEWSAHKGGITLL